MTCRELVELVTDYFEDSLAPENRQRFEQHLSACVYCDRYVEQMRVTVRTVGRLDEESISPEARDTLLGAFKDWSAQQRASGR
ncbi:MAG: hypothetical protein QOC55_1480 [Thermoleophilaceae bacterium]|jgi:anti-sigma factor RsiW|nr:hypothetical protein [Thermoleophilaceae bacterium]